MAELDPNQLILLDNLIYLKRVADKGNQNKTVGQLVNDLLFKGGLEKSQDPTKIGTDDEYPAKISYERWRQILTNIKNDPKLCDLRITDPVDEVRKKTIDGKEYEVGGMRAACFVDPSGDATVVFRGTNGPFEWHDNGEGGYLADTTQQKAALAYIEGLKYNNITVTGHSKGGNKSQYVAIMSDKVDRCVSIDGQGFSKEFLEKYADRIAANRDKITSISASNDFVHCLLNQIAGTQIFIGTESEGKDFLHYHCPDILLDANGQLRGITGQSALAQLVNKFSIYVNTKIDDPVRRDLINGLIAKTFEGSMADESPEEQEKAMEMLKSVFADFVKEELTPTDVLALINQDELHDYGFDLLRDKYGPFAELMVVSLASVIAPPLFVDDLGHALWSNCIELINSAIEKLKKFALALFDRLTRFGDWIMQTAEEAGQAILQFVSNARAAWRRFEVYITGLVNEFIRIGQMATEAMENFIKRLGSAVLSFFRNIANGVKNLLAMFGKDGVIRKEAAEALNRIEKATVGINKRIDSARADIRKQYEEFLAGANYLTRYTERTLNRLGREAVPALRNFSKRVIRGMGAYAQVQLSVDLIRLADLQSKMRNMERYFGDTVHQILSDSNRVCSDVGRNYSEYYVQQQIHAIDRTCDQLRQSNRRLCDLLQRKVNSLQYALGQYKQIENLLCREIRS